MTVMLDIKPILNANPSWARSNLGSLEELTASIKRDGIVRPILIQPDYLVIDGARRLVVAKTLGIRTVPVIWVTDWQTVMVNFEPNSSDALPMDWPDLLGFWANILKPIHNESRWAKAAVTRRANKAAGIEVAEKQVYSEFLHDLGRLHGTEPGTVKLMRDYIAKLQRSEEQVPTFVKGAFAAFPTGEAARDLTRARFIKALLDRVLKGEITEEEGLTVLTIKLRQGASANGARGFRRQSAVRFDPAAKPVPTHKLDTLVSLLDGLGLQACEFLNFSLEPDECTELLKKISTAMSQFGSLTRRMQQSVEHNQQQGETE